MSQGVGNRGSQISVPLALRVRRAEHAFLERALTRKRLPHLLYCTRMFKSEKCSLLVTVLLFGFSVAFRGPSSAWKNSCGRASAEALLRFIFAKKVFVHPILSLRTEGVFRGSFSPRAQNAKVGRELAVDLLCGTNPVPNFTGN